MKKAMLILIVVTTVMIAFFAGIKWNQFNYDDICLDLGGGKNPGDYPICIIEISKDQKQLKQKLKNTL